MSADLVLTVPEVDLEAELDLTPNAATPYARFLVRTALVRTPDDAPALQIAGPHDAAKLAQGLAQLEGAVGQIFCVALDARLRVVAIRTLQVEARELWEAGAFFGKYVTETLVSTSASAGILVVPVAVLREGDRRWFRATLSSARPCVGALIDAVFTDGRNAYSTEQGGFV